MRISELQQGRIDVLDIEQVNEAPFAEEWTPRSEVILQYSEAEGWLLQRNDWICAIQGSTGDYKDILHRLAIRRLPYLAWIVQRIPPKGKNNGLSIQIHEFSGVHHWSDPIEIGLNDQSMESLRRQRGIQVSVQAGVDWLTEQLLIPMPEQSGTVRTVLSGSPTPSPKQKTAFRLYGKNCIVDISTGADQRLLVTRVMNLGQINEDQHRPMYLASGAIKFCDVTQAGKIRQNVQTELDALVNQADSYLGLWQQYNNRELAAIRRRASEFGWIHYRQATKLANGLWRFDLDVPTKDIQSWRRKLEELEDDLLEADQMPPDLQEEGDFVEATRRDNQHFVGSIKGRWTGSYLDLSLPPQQENRNPPEDGGYLFISLMGDQVRLRRREKAWQAIRSAVNPMPQLGLMIEKQPVPARQVRRRNPMTPEVRKVFPSPNDQQKIALDIALNTPDIALIQGPPGTGKTRVIAALQARLANSDEGFSEDSFAGNTLLTSFQHAAVEHAAAATRVMGLPALKIGSHRGTQEIVDGALEWAKETAAKVRKVSAANPVEHSIHAALRTIRQRLTAAIEAPGPQEKSLALLEAVHQVAQSWLPTSLNQEIQNLADQLRRSKRKPGLAEADRAAAMNAVRALRVEPIPFDDDGPAIAYQARTRLAQLKKTLILSDEEQKTLQEAIAWEPDQPVDARLLSRLNQVRNDLIDRLQPPQRDEASLIHADVQNRCIQVLDILNQRAKSLAPGVDIAVEEWLNALDNDDAGIRETLQHYTMVLAATCQQAISKNMADVRSGKNTVFRNVIVDEAARANPLDLLIPLSLAERRIVLVGDHRQLPHILEPDIERELEESIQEETRTALRDSLFERLFLELKEREKIDGVKRTVTLNLQYRMHPVLGDFVSQQFYETHGESLASGRLADEFAHSVTLADQTALSGKVAVWIDLPHQQGTETGGRSKRRPIEADVVVREVKNLRSRYPALSVGVISFYAAQHDEILAKMVSAGLTEPDEESGYRIRDELTPDGREGLRVGTVDAFQGKEFDVVMLSLTRSNTVVVKDERTRRQRYGFLLLANRLCVAMSRQHRLLIVVGDMAMATGLESEASVPALIAFKQLCEGSHGCIVRA